MSNSRRRPAALAALGLSFFPALAFAAAARVDFTVGNVSLIAPTGEQRPLKKGDAVDVGDTVKTNGGRAQLRFTDGAYVSLQPDTLFRVDQYRFEGRTDGSERGFFSLLQGGLRTITGLVGRTNKRNYQVQTRVATIGIRGTEYQLKLDTSLSGSVGEGEVGVCNAGGCLGVASGQSFFVLDPTTLPALTAVRTSFAPPQPGPLQSPKIEDQSEGTGPPSAPVLSVQVVGENETGEPPTPGSPITPTPPILRPPISEPPPDGGSAVKGLALAYARDNGPDRLGSVVTGVVNNSTATFNNAGQLISYVAPSQIDLRQSSQSITDSGNDGIIGWGTWRNVFLDRGVEYTLESNQGMHYVIGKPAPTPQINQGIAVYDLLQGGATRPTGTDNGPPGVLNAASLRIDFQARRVDLSMQVDYGGQAYGVNTWGSQQDLMTLNRGQASFDGAGLPTTGCAGSCGTNVQGIVVGDTAQRAGFAYQINDSVPAAAAASPLSIHGAAALGRRPD